MYKQNANHDLTLSDDQAIWRYMDVPKFIQVIDTSSLYFSTVHQFDDPYEAYVSSRLDQSLDQLFREAISSLRNGLHDDRCTAEMLQAITAAAEDAFRSIPDQRLARIAELNTLMRQLGVTKQDLALDELVREAARRAVEFFRSQTAADDGPWLDVARKAMTQIATSHRNQVFVNCWHINDGESAAMWKLYLNGRDGVSIRSTLGRLKRSLRISPEEVSLGAVQYADVMPSFGVDFDPSRSVLLKRPSFRHENELRAIHTDKDNTVYNNDAPIPLGNIDSFHGAISRALDVSQAARSLGKEIRVDLGDLIEEVYVSPLSPPYLLRGVRALNKTFGLNAPVIQSQLYTIQ